MRKTKFTSITRAGRDSGKKFLLTEMSALRADKWATRLLMAMVEAGVELPTDIYETGMAGVAAVGFKAVLTMKFDTAEMLLDELMTCVEIVPDPNKTEVRRGLIGDDIEEVATLMILRSEVFELHTGFSIAGALSHLITALPAEVTKNTPTSDPSSELSSQADLPL